MLRCFLWKLKYMWWFWSKIIIKSKCNERWDSLATWQLWLPKMTHFLRITGTHRHFSRKSLGVTRKKALSLSESEQSQASEAQWQVLTLRVCRHQGTNPLWALPETLRSTIAKAQGNPIWLGGSNGSGWTSPLTLSLPHRVSTPAVPGSEHHRPRPHIHLSETSFKCKTLGWVITWIPNT